MELKKPLYIFVLALSMITLLRILIREFGIMGDATFTLAVVICIGLCTYASTKLLNDFKPDNGYLRRILPVFFLYEIVIVARGFSFDYGTIKELLQSDFLFWVYVIPLFIYFSKDLVTFAFLTDIIFYLAIFYLVGAAIHPAFVNTRALAENYNHTFAFACGFLLLNAKYLSKEKYIVAFIALLIGVVSFIFLARRNGILSYGALMLCGVLLNMKNISAASYFKIFPLLAGIGIIVLLNTDALPASFTKRINDRLTEDSRSYVVENLLKDMEDHEIFGKGMKGVYYAPMGGGGPNEDGIEFAVEDYRQLIENGYLQMYLNGGILYLVLFGLVMLPAVFLGIFKSSNQFCKAAAIIVLLWLIDMSVFGLPRLTFQYILVWICAGICYTKSLREKTEEEVSEVFANYKTYDYEDTLVH